MEQEKPENLSNSKEDKEIIENQLNENDNWLIQLYTMHNEAP